MTTPNTHARSATASREALPDMIKELLRREGKARVQPLELPDGRKVWLKRPENRSSLRWRIQKGDPRRAFEADLAGLRFLGDRGLPGAAVLHSGKDYIVLADAGQPAHKVLANDLGGEGLRAVEAAAKSLALLHNAGARHGRPKLRDICWDGQTARLIDFERFQPNASARAMGLDWIILLHSLLETCPDGEAAFATAVRSYREAAPAAAIAAGTHLIGRLKWAEPFLSGALYLWPRNREINAAARLRRAFRAV